MSFRDLFDCLIRGIKSLSCLGLYLWLSGILAGVFLLFPSLDLGVARLANLAPGVFVFTEIAWLEAIHRYIGLVLVVGLVFAAGVFAWNHTHRTEFLGLNRRGMIYMVATAVVGPGLVVNGIFKSLWGRARPVQLLEFGGLLKFTPAGMVSLQCTTNCSFVSGDVATAVWLLGFAFVIPQGWQRRVAVALGLAMGLALAVIRVGQGGHFLSDVVWAGIVTIGIQFLLAEIILKPCPNQPTGVERILAWLRSWWQRSLAVGCKLLHGFDWSDLIPVSLLTLGLILATMVLLDIPLASLAQILPDEVNRWAERLSILGSSGPYFLVCGVGWIALRLGAKDEFGARLRNYSWALMLVICALIVSGILANLLKLIFAHFRPQNYFDSKGWIGFHFLHLDMIGSGFLRSFKRSYSFPSGHTTTAFALATVAAAYWPRFRLYLFSAAGVVGAMRVLSLDHWPSDIFAGALVGMVAAEYTIAIFNHAGVGPAAVWARQAAIDQRLKWQPKGDYRALARNWKHWLLMRPFTALDKGSGG